MTKEFKYIGKRLVRKDAYDKVTGRGIFTVDVQLPRMLQAKILRSPYAHANILKIDASKAMKLPGVIATLTYEDVPRVAALHHDPKARDYYVLDDKVRWVGDDVAAVAAETVEIAEEALSLIEVEYEVLQAVFSVEEALKKDAPVLHPQLDYGSKDPSNVVPTGHATCEEFGDIERGFSDADVVLEEKIRIASQCHCYWEQHAAAACWDRPDHLTIWMSMQCPHRQRDELANILGIARNKIRVISRYVGGGFGGKARFLRHLGIAALLAKKAHRPVRVLLTQEESMPLAVRHAADVSWKMGIKKDGRITAVERDCVMHTGSYVITGGYIGQTSLVEPLALYRVSNYRSRVMNVYTNTNPAGSFRGFGTTESNTSLAMVMFRAAEAIDMDPLEFLLKNVNPSAAKAECLRAGAEKFGWENKWKGWARPTMIQGSKKRGIGIGLTSSVRKGGGQGVGSAILTVNQDGSATVFIGSVELGQGILTAVAKIAAEELGMPYDDVTVVNGDTEITPFDSGQSGSHTTFDVGLPTLQAARDAKRQLLRLAALRLGVEPEDLEIEDGWIYVKKTPEKRLSFRDAMFTPTVQSPSETLPEKIPYFITSVVPVIAQASLTRGSKVPLQGFSADFVEVEVDTETGEVKTINYITAVDPGRAINPDGVEGQFQYAVSAGMGWSLMEEVVRDRASGRILNANRLDYKIPTTLDVAQNSSIVIVEPTDPVGPFGAKGAGEEAMAASAGAFVNAIHSAIGVKFDEFPITPSKILQALSKEPKLR